MVVDAPVVFQRQVLGVGQCRKTVELLQLQSVQFLDVIDTPVVLVTTGACVGADSAEFVEILQFWTKAVCIPLVCRYCGGSTVTVHRQVWFTCLPLCNDWCRWSRQCSLVLRRGQLIFSMMCSGYFLLPCTQVQGRGSCPQGHGPHN